MGHRFDYIDRLRGLTMVMVVVVHLTYWALLQPDNYISFLFSPVLMPIFMFLSGIVISAPPDAKKLKIKLFRFWSPFIIVGLVFTVCYLGPNRYYLFFITPHKSGYWYLYVLGVFYILLSVFKFNNSKQNKSSVIIDVVILVGVTLCAYAGEKFLPRLLSDAFSITHIRQNWMFFYCGFLVRKYNLMHEVFEKDIIFTVSLVSIVPLYFLLPITSHVFVIISICYVLVLVVLFRNRNSDHSLIEDELARFGRKSMDIYIYHYFLVSLSGTIKLHELGEWFLRTNNWLMELIFLAFLSILISYLSIAIGYIIRCSKMLRLFMFGEIEE